MADHSGKTLGPYRLEAVLGRSSGVTTYRAYQSTVRRYVAVKVVSSEIADQPGFDKRFQRESELIASLEHPHIVPVIDYGNAEGIHYLVMRYIEGGSLEDRLRSVPLSLGESARMLTQMASALDYAHKRGVIHRDLKPNNVLLDSSENVYLTNFGIARLTHSEQELTAAGSAMGTPAYMSPEQGLGRPVDARSDIYTLGVVLYEMVLNRLPFSGDTPAALIFQHVYEQPTPPQQLKADLSDAIAKVLNNAMAKNPDERYQSSGDLSEAFSEAVRDGTGAQRMARGGTEMEHTRVGGPMEPIAPPRPLPPSGAVAPAGTAAGASEDVAAEVEVIQFSAFYPELIQPGAAYALMVFAHLEMAREQVRKIAAGYSAMMGVQPTQGTTPSKIQVGAGSLLTLVPHVEGIIFSPAEQVVTWQPPYQNATFLFSDPKELNAELAGNIRIYQGPMIVGDIPIHMKWARHSKAPHVALEQEAVVRRFDPVFASYSHRDTPIMEYFRRARQNLGQTMLVDIYDLRAGEYWSDRLLRMIDESAVFQLFWSKNSAKSDYCRQEWQHALRYKEQRPRFIQPVWWKVPMPPPPDELADLHFQRVNPPAFTRIQLTVAQIRRLFIRG